MKLSALWTAPIAVGCVLLTGCSGEPAADQIGGSAVRRGCIYGGGGDSGDLNLSAAELNAFGDLRVESGPEEAAHSAACSGSLLANRWLLTSAHCTTDPESTRISVRLGARAGCDGPEQRTLESDLVVVNDSLDLMLVHLNGSAATAGFSVTPLLVDVASEPAPGQRVYLAGFGRAEDGPLGDLRFAPETITAVEDSWIEVDGLGESGACNGDSGGPLLWRDAAGRLSTLGTLSHGSATCVGTDRYVRLRAASAWLARITAPNITPQKKPAQASKLTISLEQGMSSGRRVSSAGVPQ